MTQNFRSYFAAKHLALSEFDIQDKTDKAVAKLLKRRTNAFVKDHSTKAAHRLVNILIECINRYDFSEFIDWMLDEYEDKERRSILLMTLTELLEQLGDKSRLTQVQKAMAHHTADPHDRLEILLTQLTDQGLIDL